MNRILHYTEEPRLGGYCLGQPDPACHFPQTWKYLVECLHIESVIDLGCGEGYSTKCFMDLGLDVLGIDGCEKAVNEAVVPVVLHDFYDGPYIPDREYQFAWCCEVVEHIHEEHIGNLLETIQLARCKWVGMTHATPGQGGHHHVNEQPAQYWIDMFAKYGYQLDSDTTERARTLATVEQWNHNHFVRSGMVFEAVSSV